MWVFCCGMFRSASTLQFQITVRLVKEAGIGQPIGWIDVKRFAEVRDRHPDCSANDSRLNVIKAHICTAAIAEEFWQDRAIGIYIFRDIRDVYASMMKQRQKSFDFLWNEGFLEACLENYKSWTSLPNVLVSRYETVIRDLAAEVKRIADHLGIFLSGTDCATIAADYQIEIQQERVKQFRETLLQTALNPNDHREIVDYHDEETLLHMNHIDSARVDRWKEDLTESEVGQLEESVIEWCRKNHHSPETFLRRTSQ
jgi:hypothetical protein